MAGRLLFLDSGDHLANTLSDLALKYIVGPISVVSPGRTGSCYLISGASSVYTAYRAMPGIGSSSVNATLALGQAIKTDFLTGRIATMGNSIAGVSVSLWHSYDGRLYVNTDTGSISPGSESVLTTGTWFYVEWSAYIYTSGTIPYPFVDHVVRVNNEVVLTATTSGGRMPVPAELGWSYSSVQGGPGYGASSWVDDIYCTDGEFLGDIRIGVIRPDAAGGEADFTPTGAASNWEATKDLTPDYDTTIISSDTPGQKDLVNLEDPGLIGPIKGIQANYIAIKSDAGACSFIPRYNISGTLYDSPNEFFPSWQSWRDFVDCYRKNPVTGNDWTLDEVNALKMGLTRNT